MPYMNIWLKILAVRFAITGEPRSAILSSNSITSREVMVLASR
jgi:hypothetical protein